MEKPLHVKQKTNNSPPSSPPPSSPPPPPPSPPPLTLSSLPNDLILNCLSRLPKSNYHSLSLVSKTFQSLVFSQNLYMTRSNIKNTESCLYICLKLPTHSNLCWFNLLINPNQTLINLKTNKKNSTGNVLVPVPPSLYPRYSNSIVIVDSTTYAIGGNTIPSNELYIFDENNNDWNCHTSRMKVARMDAIAGTLDGKIYVIGGCGADITNDWFEVFDTKTQTWESLMYPDDLRGYKIYEIITYEDKIYVSTNTKDYSYEPEQKVWKVFDKYLCLGKAYCEIGNIMYYFDRSFNCFMFNPESKIWKEVRGLYKLKQYSRCYKGMIDVINYGGKIMILWDKYVRFGRGRNMDKRIWCTMISLEERENGSEIWGNVEWIDYVIIVPNSYEYVRSELRIM